MNVLVEMTVSVEDGDGEVCVTICPGPGGGGSVATLLEGGCPVCSTPLDGGGRCWTCVDDRGRPVRYAAVAEGGPQ